MLLVELKLYDGIGFKSLNTIQIINRGTGDVCTGNYRIIFQDHENEKMERGSIENFERLERTALELLYETLKQKFENNDARR